MPNPFLDHRRRWPVVALASAVVAALAVIVLVVVLDAHRSAPPRGSAAPPAAVPAPPASGPSASAPPQASASASAGMPLVPFTVLHGAQVVDGVTLGYPHTKAGAVSAAVAYTADVGSTVDPERAAAIARLVADPSFADAADQTAQGIGSVRSSLGLPSAGPVPAGYGVTLTPQMYQVPDADSDRVSVLLLCTTVYSDPTRGVATLTTVMPVRLHWDQAAADWRMLDVSGDEAALAAPPFSAQAQAKGWLPLATAVPSGGG